jgi:hypothetical protein
LSWRSTSKNRIVVASEKADFIADRIVAGVPATEDEVRRLARYLREIVADMEQSWRQRASPPRPSRSPP